MIERMLRSIFSIIDWGVYKVVEILMQLIMDLANVEIFAKSVINEFASRIYIILGLVMLFKIMISFIQILINPDKMNDKEQGVGNILKRVVISLALIFLVPSIFDLARQVQGQIIPIIPKVVLGANINQDGNGPDEAMESVGRLMAFYSYIPFFTYQNETCNDGSILGTGDDTNAIIWSVGTAKDNINKTDPCSTDSNGFKYSYTFILPTVVGAYLVYVLVSVAIAIAIRAIKFGICEFVAPIPIASYIDPKTSKQTFDKWVSTSIKIYLDLFIRLIIVYFVVFVFLVVFDADNLDVILANVGGSWMRKSLVILFIILGLLQFVKQAPKFISDLLGIQGSGDIMGMFKGEGWKSLGGMAGTVGATVGSGIGNAMYAWRNGERLRAIFRGLGGAAAAGVRGSVATASGKGWRGAFSDNVRTTTSNSHRRVNRGAIARASQNEYNEEVGKHTRIRDNLQARYHDFSDRLLVNENTNKTLRQQLYEAESRQSTATSKVEYDAAQRDIDRYSAQIEINERQRATLQEHLSDFQHKIEKENEAIANVAKPISPIRNTISGAFDTFTGMQSVNGASILEASSTLSSMRSTYYTGEAMKKLGEEGTQIKDILSMGATFSEVSSAYDALRNGSVSSVTIGGKTYDSSRVQEVGELFKKAEKEAAIKYIDAVRDGRIKNSTIEEGFKQIYGALDGMGLDAATKAELIREFEKSPGNFLKSLSDVSKRLETEGKRRQAYEREQKKNS